MTTGVSVASSGDGAKPGADGGSFGTPPPSREVPVTEAPGAPAASRVPVVLLSLSVGGVFFLLILLGYIGGGISEKEESRIFVLSSLIVPAAAIVASWGLDRAKRKFFLSSALFFPVLLASHAAF